MSWAGSRDDGTLVAFNAYIAFVFPPIVRFVDLATVFQRAITGLENVFALLDTKPEVTDLPGGHEKNPYGPDEDYRGEEGAVFIAQSVPVHPYRSYRLRAWVKTENTGPQTAIHLLAVTPDGRELCYMEPPFLRPAIGTR